MTQKFEMADRFNPSAVEQALYQHWEESGYFKPSENENMSETKLFIQHLNHAFKWVYRRNEDERT